MRLFAIHPHMNRVCRLLQHGAIIAAGLLVTLQGSAGFAQEEGGGVTPNVSFSRGWIFEAVIVAVMFALALFVICRSSRRN